MNETSDINTNDISSNERERERERECVCMYVCMYVCTQAHARTFVPSYIGLMNRVFANGPGDLGSILGQVIPKTQKKKKKKKKKRLMLPYLTLSIIKEGSRVKWSNPGNGVAPFPTPLCGSYWKGSLWVTLNKGQLYTTHIVHIIWKEKLTLHLLDTWVSNTLHKQICKSKTIYCLLCMPEH